MVLHVVDKVARRIVLGKDALGEARALVYNSDSEFSLMKGLWLCDFAMEIFTPAICEHLGIIVVPPNQAKKADLKTPNLHEYINAIYTHFSTSGLNQSALARVDYLGTQAKRIHEKRNQVQHEGVSFSPVDTRGWVAEVASYLDEISNLTFGMNTDSITISIMVKDDEARENFNQAQQKLSVGDFDEAAELTAKGYSAGTFNAVYMSYDFSKRDQATVIKRSQISFSSIVLGNMSSIHGSDFNADREVRKALERLVEQLSPTQFGISLSKSSKFLALLPGVDRAPGSARWYSIGKPKSYTREEVQFLLDTAIEIVYRAEGYFS